MDQYRFQKQQPKPKQKEKGCTIEMKKTKVGKKIQFKGNCTKEQMKVLAQDNGVNLED